MPKTTEQNFSFQEQSLQILGHKGENVANTFFRQDLLTKHLAIILPGAGEILSNVVFELIKRPQLSFVPHPQIST